MTLFEKLALDWKLIKYTAYSTNTVKAILECPAIFASYKVQKVTETTQKESFFLEQPHNPEGFPKIALELLYHF